MNPKWVKGLSVISETTNSQNKTGGKLLDMNLYNFLDLTPKAKTTKGKVNKWIYIKLKKQQGKPTPN